MNSSYDSRSYKNLLNMKTPSSSSRNIINNYLVKVDDALLFRKLLQNKYREDLDNIIRHKRSDSQNSQNQSGDDLLKIQRMNDKYNFEKITQKKIFKEYNAYNEKEAEEKKQKMKEFKDNQFKEYLQKVNSINMENEISKKINQEKKEQLRQQMEKDLLAYRQKRFDEKEKEKKEYEEYINKKKNNDIFLDIQKNYRSKISRMNNNIYENALRYNDYLNEGKHNDLFNVKNDLIYNKKVAEIKEKEKHEKMLQTIQNLKLQEQKKNIQNMFEQELKEQKIQDQHNYKDFLDKQKAEQKNNNNILISSGEQLLMPSYRYSNVPKSLINYTLSRNSNAVINTLKNDESPKKFYLGDSNLKHNPITFPVEDDTSKNYILNQIYKEQKLNRLYSNSVDNKNYFSFKDNNNNDLNL